MDEKLSKTYENRELILAATLVTLGFELTGINYQFEGNANRPVGYFLFNDSKELGLAIRQFWSGQLAVEPRTFSNNVRSLRAQVNGTYSSPNSQFAQTDLSTTKKQVGE